MSKTTEKAITAVRDALHEACKDLAPADYKQVLEALEGDIDGNLDALKDENPDLCD
jgi:hypothetical protein